MANKDEKYVDEYMKRTIRLGKAVEGQSKGVADKLAKTHADIVNRVKKEYPMATGKTIQKLNKDIADKLIEDYQKGVIPDIDKAFEEIISKESAWASQSLQIVAGEGSTAVVNSERIAKVASKKTYQGHTFNFWFKKAGEKTSKRAMSMLESAYVNGATTDETVRQLEAVLTKSRNDIKTLSRSYFNHAATEARTQALDANERLIEGYYWVSILDGRTTPAICGVRDGLEYDKKKMPVNHGLPWGAGPGRMHFNCRSSFIPKVAGSGDIRKYIERPAIGPGKAYSKGDMTTKFGNVRKPTKYNRDKDILSVKQVSGTTRYEEWLRTKKTSFVEDVLGNKSLAQEFKDGKITLLDVAKRGNLSDINQL